MSGFKIFTLAGIPVYVSFWYFLIMAWIGLRTDNALMWIFVVTFSILVHEFGHALTARHYRLAPSVLLHGWGGLCSHQRAERDLHDVFIISAGPGAGFVLGLITGAAWLATSALAPQVLQTNPTLRVFFEYMIYVNLFWSLVNLIPLWPLDGGQLFRLGMVRLFGGARGEKITHITGIVVSVVAGLLAYQFLSGYFALILCGFLAYDNYRRLSSPGASGPIRTPPKDIKPLLKEAQAAMQGEDWHEAARLAHVARDAGRLADKDLQKIWSILTIATAQQGDYEEALSYAKRAPDTPEVAEAQVWSLVNLERHQEAQALLEGPRGALLPEVVRQDVRQALTEGPS